MKVSDCLHVLENLAPTAFQESYDNSGLILGTPEKEVSGVMTCLDLSMQVISEAISQKCNLIIAHHPFIFAPLKRINPDSRTGQLIWHLIQSDIAVIAVHTNFDNVKGGINQHLANRLNLLNTRFLEPRKGLLRKLVTFCPVDYSETLRKAICDAGAGNIGNYDQCTFNAEGFGTFRANEKASPFVGKKNQLHRETEVRIETIFPAYKQNDVLSALLKAHPYEEVAYDIYPLENTSELAGSGIVGDLKEKLTKPRFFEFLMKSLKCSDLRYCDGNSTTISRVAICSGSGSFLINRAIASGAQAFVSADLKYHDFQENEGRILLVDAGHFETEIGVKDLIRIALLEKFPNFAVFASKKEKNPIKYISS
jgi:dinuclear metal center YbgI/SA1388 family protein